MVPEVCDSHVDGGVFVFGLLFALCGSIVYFFPFASQAHNFVPMKNTGFDRELQQEVVEGAVLLGFYGSLAGGILYSASFNGGVDLDDIKVWVPLVCIVMLATHCGMNYLRFKHTKDHAKPMALNKWGGVSAQAVLWIILGIFILDSDHGAYAKFLLIITMGVAFASIQAVYITSFDVTHFRGETSANTSTHMFAAARHGLSCLALGLALSIIPGSA